MKKILLKSGIIALGINTLMAVVNYICGMLFDEIMGITFVDCECEVTYGFGISLMKSYPFYTSEEPIQEVSGLLEIAPVNFILTFVGVFVLCYIISLSMPKFRIKKEFKSEFCEVKYEPGYNVVFVKWKKFCCKEDYRKPLKYALKIIKSYENCDYVADTRSGFENIPEDTQWVADYFMPKAVEYGCKCIYFIIDENNSLKEELEGQASDSSDIIAFKYIYSLDEVKE